MAGRQAIRASDADRDRVTELLRTAAAEGRLLTEELEQRLESALSARTYGQLDALIADLPGPGLAEQRRPRRLRRSRLALIGSTVGFVLGVSLAAVLVLAIVLQLAVGVLATWWIWVAAGWLFFGRRRHHGPTWHTRGGWPARRMRVHRSSWTYWG
jgi:DUF1707 SHOCT-like domain